MHIQRRYGRCSSAGCAAAAVALVLAGGVACAPPANARRDLSSAYPPARAKAIIQVTEARDAEAIPGLVTLLEDDDPAVRMYAIGALERMTGETLGYRYYDREAARSTAVQRWREALREGQVVVRGSGRPRETTPPRSSSKTATAGVRPEAGP